MSEATATPAALATLTVDAVVAELLAAEGPYTVEGRYIACADLARRARREAAERRVRAAERAAERPCPWCSQAIAPDVAAVTMAGDRLHPACAEALEVELWGAPADAPEFAPVDESDAAVWEELAGTERVLLAGYSEGYADGAEVERRTLLAA